MTEPITEIGFQEAFPDGQLVAPRDNQALFAPMLTVEGQLAWYKGQSRFFTGDEGFGSDFLQLCDEPFDLRLAPYMFDDDVTLQLLRQKIGSITLVGEIIVPPDLIGVLQFLAVDKHEPIKVGPADDEQ